MPRHAWPRRRPAAAGPAVQAAAASPRMPPLGAHPGARTHAAWRPVTDIGSWLRALGLGRYEAAFRDNDIAADVLPDLTPKDLNDIGVASVGDRRRLIAAAAALRARS